MDEFADLDADLSRPFAELVSSLERQKAVDALAPKYEASIATSGSVKGYHRVGQPRDFETQWERFQNAELGHQSLLIDEYEGFHDGTSGLLVVFLIVFFPLLFLLAIGLLATAVVFLPIFGFLLLSSYVSEKIGLTQVYEERRERRLQKQRDRQIAHYTNGGHPHPALLRKTHFFLNEDGLIVVPLKFGLPSFRAQLLDDMVVRRHFHEWSLESIAIIRPKNRREGRSKELTYAHLDIMQHVDVEDVDDFLGLFHLEEQTVHTYNSSDSGGGGGGG